MSCSLILSFNFYKDICVLLKSKNYMQMIFAAILFGGMVFSAKLLEQIGVTFLEVSIIPSLLVSTCLFFYLRKKVFDVSSDGKKWLFYYVLTNVVIDFGQYMPLFMGVSVGLTLLLMYTQPICTILISSLILKRKVKLYEMIVFILIVLGTYILIWGGELKGSFMGVIIALLGGLGLSLEVFCAERLSLSKVSANVTYFWLFLLGGIILSIFGYAFYDPSSPILSFEIYRYMSFDIIIYMMIFTFLFYWLGNFLMYKGYEKVPALHGGLILLLEPLIGVLLDVTILKTELTLNILIGGSLILLGNWILIYKANDEMK